MHRYFIQLSYKGTDYHGWQIQKNTVLTIQSVINAMLSKLINEPIFIMGCGRTDTGVHATEYFAHFDCTHSNLLENEKKWLFKFNHALPADIAIQKMFLMKENANARFHAISRTYKYRISQTKNPFQINGVYFFYGELNVAEMNKAAKLLFNHSDFKAFAKTGAETSTNICNIYLAEWTEENGELVFTISANRFLRNMVRSIVGTMLRVGKGIMTIEEFNNVIESKNRSNAGMSAHASGLYLIKVDYPEGYFDAITAPCGIVEGSEI
jgi:tRNA pseudouridine38-40 synthase